MTSASVSTRQRRAERALIQTGEVRSPVPSLAGSLAGALRRRVGPIGCHDLEFEVALTVVRWTGCGRGNRRCRYSAEPRGRADALLRPELYRRTFAQRDQAARRMLQPLEGGGVYGAVTALSRWPSVFFTASKPWHRWPRIPTAGSSPQGWKPKPSWTSPWSAARVMRGYLLAKPELEFFHSNPFA